MAAASVAHKLKRKADVPSAEPELKRSVAADSAAHGFPTAGDLVWANFKGLAETEEDWEQALVVGIAKDSTYTLEYVDEGLIEENVPSSRIRSCSSTAPPEALFNVQEVAHAAGETVLGNFRGLGDWDEALVVGVAADGTYTLEYVDEGLVEENVPRERIASIEGADVRATALALSSGTLDVASLAEARDEEADSAAESEAEEVGGGDGEDQASEVLSALRESNEDFIYCRRWLGPKHGYCFKASDRGVGYHKDVPLHVAAEEAEKANMVLTAAQLANWWREVLLMPPSVKKVDRFMDLFDLPALRVQALSTPTAKAPPTAAVPPALFESLPAWFDAQLPLLARRCAPAELEVTLRVFLAPQQSVRQGLEHVTFSIDWLRVSGECEGEPLSAALLRQMGLAGRRPAKMLLVLIYRAERNKITNIWVEVDREGLGNRRAATLDDAMLSDVFDRALTLARRSGAIGELNPFFYNYFEAPTVGM